MNVLVIGGGNAALCAALTAREGGASVMLLESAPPEWRGGGWVCAVGRPRSGSPAPRV